MVAEQAASVPASWLPRLSLLEVSCSVPAQLERDHRGEGADHERNAPAPGLQLGLAQQLLQHDDTSTASSWPPISVTYWNEEKKPRWPRSATSLM